MQHECITPINFFWKSARFFLLKGFYRKCHSGKLLFLKQFPENYSRNNFFLKRLSKLIDVQKQSSRGDLYKVVFGNFAKFTGKRSPRPATLFKKRLWHRCFPVNFEKFLRAPFLTDHLRCMLLDIHKK